LAPPDSDDLEGYDAAPRKGEEEYLRFPGWMQALLVVLLAAVLAVAVAIVVEGWADWVVLGGIIVAVIGMMVAVNRRQYPTRKRSFTKDSDSKW
jgi:membrane protein YdbS with pleckstrin-like domain